MAASVLEKAEGHTILPVERLGDTLLVTPHGDLGGYSPHAFHAEYQRVQDLLDDSSIKNLIIDLGGSRYFGSEMVGALVAMRQKVADRGRAVITDVSDDTLVGLEMVKADRLFELYDSRSKALHDVPRMTIGERARRHRKKLGWMVAVALLVGVAWGFHETKVGYQIFGSRTARTYETIARKWNRLEAEKVRWTAEEARSYRAVLLDDLLAMADDMQNPGLIRMREDVYLREAVMYFIGIVRNEKKRFEFLKNMRYARSLIRKRTGLELTLLGPEDFDEMRKQAAEEDGELPPADKEPAMIVQDPDPSEELEDEGPDS